MKQRVRLRNWLPCPNTYAINLRTNNSKVFGLLVPAIFNRFYESFISAAEQKARENGFSLMILKSGDDPLPELENIRLAGPTGWQEL